HAGARLSTAAATTTAAAAASSARVERWQDPYRHRFRLPAEHHHHAALGAELDDLACRFVDCPDVVLSVDVHRVREQEPIDALTDLAHEVPVLIELKEPRAA